jgi:hypothetical protein
VNKVRLDLEALNPELQWLAKEGFRSAGAWVWSIASLWEKLDRIRSHVTAANDLCLAAADVGVRRRVPLTDALRLVLPVTDATAISLSRLSDPPGRAVELRQVLAEFSRHLWGAKSLPAL